MGQFCLDNNLFNHIDLEKNKAEGIDIFSISYRSQKKIWFKCLEKDYHGSYKSRCSDFTYGSRCPYCGHSKLHPLDSVAQNIINIYGDLYKIWNKELNKGIDPFSIALYSNDEYWWNCPDGKHEPYLRKCSSSTMYKYRCPECYEPPRGENHPNWNPNKSQEEREKGRNYFEYTEFINNVLKRDDYTCQITGMHGGNLVVHHINGYHWDKKHRTDLNNAITLSKEIHILFHNIYGRKNNTEEQFNDFLEKIENGEIDISNIN